MIDDSPRVLMKGSPRSLRVMAPPPYYMLIHSVSFDITLVFFNTTTMWDPDTFTGGTCSLDVKIKRGLL
jgi:hypothetical protein